MTKDLYFEDFHIGQKFNSISSHTVTAEEIKTFGQKYDPQPFHLDEAAGEASFFAKPPFSTAWPPPDGSPPPSSCDFACCPYPFPEA